MTTELFELSMLGGAVERRYRRLRPEVENLPWGTLNPADYPPALVEAARRTWTEAAFQEHRTGAACAATLKAMIAARAPLDLIAMATRFPLDEMVHVEMCARLTMELGGAIALVHEPTHMIAEPRAGNSALLQAAELIVRNFCVGEALSIPVLRGSWHAATHPLIKAVLGRIVKDEAAHGQLGWMFLDWAEPLLTADDQRFLAQCADETIAAVTERWKHLPEGDGAATLGWMPPQSYLALAVKALKVAVVEPLRARGIAVVEPAGPWANSSVQSRS